MDLDAHVPLRYLHETRVQGERGVEDLSHLVYEPGVICDHLSARNESFEISQVWDLGGDPLAVLETELLLALESLGEVLGEPPFDRPELFGDLQEPVAEP